MESLRQELDCSELQRQLSQLEEKLNVAVSENERQQRVIGELTKWKEKLEKESKKRLCLAVVIHTADTDKTRMSSPSETETSTTRPSQDCRRLKISKQSRNVV